MLAPKGIVEKGTWQRISRSVDTVDAIHSNVSKMLVLKDYSPTRNILISNELLEWRALLRHSKYLENKENGTVFNIYGQSMGDDMLNISKKLEDKRKDYWKSHVAGVNLQNIRCERLNLGTGFEIEYDSEDDEE